MGPQTLQNTARLKYLPLSGRTTGRNVIHGCGKFFKNKPIIANNWMDGLPLERVTPSSTLLNVGLDLGGLKKIIRAGERIHFEKSI